MPSISARAVCCLDTLSAVAASAAAARAPAGVQEEERKAREGGEDHDTALTVSTRMNPKVVKVYKSVGTILSRYRSGKLPKAFKLIPNLSNWEEVRPPVGSPLSHPPPFAPTDSPHRLPHPCAGPCPDRPGEVDAGCDVRGDPHLRVQPERAHGAAVRGARGGGARGRR